MYSIVVLMYLEIALLCSQGDSVSVLVFEHLR